MFQENPDGNREYKLKLLDPPDERIQELVSQMRFRCHEGNGECFYNLGVKDDGTLYGISQEDYEKTIDHLNKIAEKNNYSTSVINQFVVRHEPKELKVYEILIREKNDNNYIDIKVCVAGNVDSSKSTTIACLISGQLDNGRGLRRLSVFNYLHEMKTGRTSSISHEIMGFDYKGNVVNYENVNKMSWNDIVQRSSKIISFDLAGHEKYLKTTIMGLTSSLPNICMILIGANSGISKITKEHIFLCITLKIPFIFVISKIDLVNDRQNILDETISGINVLLKHPSVRRIPIHIKNNEDLLLCAKNVYSNSITPIFQTSNVTGEGLPILRSFFNLVSEKDVEHSNNNNVEYFIDNIFSVKGVGIVIGGHLLSGSIKTQDTLFIGPTDEGKFETIIVKSIHAKKVNVQKVKSGGYVCLAFKKLDKKLIRKGIVLLSSVSQQLSVRIFTAKIDVLKTHATTIKIGYEPLFCCNSIRQTARIIEIIEKKNLRNSEDMNILRTNDSAIVKLQLKYRPEYIKAQSRFILCEGNVKIVGEIL